MAKTLLAIEFRHDTLHVYALVNRTQKSRAGFARLIGWAWVW